MRDATSYTELSTLASCEMKWAFRYREHVKSEATDKMKRGTAIHELAGTWWTGDDEAMLIREREVFDAIEDEDERALLDWLLDRYKRHYGAARNGGAARVVATELRLASRLPGTDVEIVTYVDQVVKTRSGLWAVERKSMGDWRRLNHIDVDPQVTIALWQLWQHEWPVQGLMYDAIRTYRWKPDKPTQKLLIEEAAAEGRKLTRDEARLAVEQHPGIERPLDDSFQLLYLDRNEEHIAAALEEARAAVRRRAVLGAGEVPMRNIGPGCDNCPFRDECFERLAFPQVIEVISE